MKASTLRTLLCLVALLAAASVAQADQITGALPLAGIDTSKNGPNLAVSTFLTDVQTLTSGPGLGDFSVVPLLADYGPLSLDLPTIATGGGSQSRMLFTEASSQVPETSILNPRIFSMSIFSAPILQAQECPA